MIPIKMRRIKHIGGKTTDGDNVGEMTNDDYCSSRSYVGEVSVNEKRRCDLQ